MTVIAEFLPWLNLPFMTYSMIVTEKFFGEVQLLCRNCKDKVNSETANLSVLALLMKVTVGFQSSIGTTIPEIVNLLKHSDGAKFLGQLSCNFSGKR